MVDRMEQPLMRKLKEYNKTMLPMHMPGHKRNLALSGRDGYLTALCADCDITEIAGFDNLAEPEEIFLTLKQRAARLWKSEEAYPLVNGSTCGILAAIYATVPYGGEVIVARNCHKSVYNGLQLVNARVTYLLPEQEPVTGTYGRITKEAVEAALREVPNAKLVILTSPTYEGILSDIEGICEIAHKKGIPVLVDSAHGAHLGFGDFPKGAVECGADLVVHSLHKTLPCLTQTAMLHRNGDLVSGQAVQNAINMFQTSSPSYLLLASIEGCVGLLEEQGDTLFREWEEALSRFYQGACLLKNLRIPGEAMERTEDGVAGASGDREMIRDLSKLIIVTEGTGLTGPGLMELLREEHCIELEMAAERYGLAMTGPGDTRESLNRLLKALFAIDEKCCIVPGRETVYPSLPPVRLTIGEAMGSKGEEVLLEEAMGRIAAEHLWAYPPGIPVVVAGEEITEDVIAYLTEKRRQGVELHRMNGSCKEELMITVTRASEDEERNL